MAVRAIAKLHRMGMARKTMGEDVMCTSKYTPFLPGVRSERREALFGKIERKIKTL